MGAVQIVDLQSAKKNAETLSMSKTNCRRAICRICQKFSKNFGNYLVPNLLVSVVNFVIFKRGQVRSSEIC